MSVSIALAYMEQSACNILRGSMIGPGSVVGGYCVALYSSVLISPSSSNSIDMIQSIPDKSPDLFWPEVDDIAGDLLSLGIPKAHVL